MTSDTRPDSGMVSGTAINGGAHVLVTLDLRHMAAPAARFGITAERPAETMRRLR